VRCEVFTAEVLPSNYRMIQVFRDSGFDVRVRSAPGLLLVEFPTMLTRARSAAGDDGGGAAAQRLEQQVGRAPAGRGQLASGYWLLVMSTLRALVSPALAKVS
jgi:hypothetical protein